MDRQICALRTDVDIFCQVIDNFGDAGTAWRLCRELRSLLDTSCRIRLFIDDPDTLAALAGGREELARSGVQVCRWDRLRFRMPSRPASPWVIEMFACPTPEDFVYADRSQTRLIVNLEYFSCEAWALDCHLRESLLGRPVPRKFFFIPGLDAGSGGIMSLSRAQLCRTDRSEARKTWLSTQGLDPDLADLNWLLLFSYRDVSPALLDRLAAASEQWLVWSLGQANCRLRGEGGVRVLRPPFLAQSDFDCLLALADLNLVRGEDSLAGALLAGKPFLWQLYPQEDETRRLKMEAFLAALARHWKRPFERDAFETAMRAFNFPQDDQNVDWDLFLTPSAAMGRNLAACAAGLRNTCNLTEKLLRFVFLFFQGEIR